MIATDYDREEGDRSMDLRVEKTENAIKNAFLELRSKKALEKITVKELCENAKINKSTFYAHYQDIYALSDALEEEVVKNITDSIPSIHSMSGNLAEFTKELTCAFTSQSTLINMLFSGNQRSHLSARIEESLKEGTFAERPELRGSVRWNVILSYCIQGSYWAFEENRKNGEEETIAVIGEISELLQPLYSRGI